MKHKKIWEKRTKGVCEPYKNLTKKDHINLVKVWLKLKVSIGISTSAAKNLSYRRYIILNRQTPTYVLNPSIVALSDERSSITISYKNIRWEDVVDTFHGEECLAIIDELYNMLRIETIYEGLRKDNSILCKYYPLTSV
jgi:hypothetical protein